MPLAPRRPRSLALVVSLTLTGGLAACAPTLERACSSDADCPAGERCSGSGRCVSPAAPPGADEGVARPDATGPGDAHTPPAADLAITPPPADLSVAPADAATPPLDGPMSLPPDAQSPDARLPDAGADGGPVTLADAAPDARRPPADAAPDAHVAAPDVFVPPPDDAFVPTPDACFAWAEVCNGLDDDCNGLADEDADGAPMRLECYDGDPATLDRGLCHAGVTQCVAGRPLPCADQVLPLLETCNGLDDDCDGEVDDVAGLGQPCVGGVGACERPGVFACLVERGRLVCDASPGFGTPELCNGIDDDCNGQVDDSVLVEEICNGRDDNCDGHADEGFGVGEPCSVGVGACQRSGVFQCTLEGRVQCSVDAFPPAVETCDGTDENCNGVVDDVPGLNELCTSGLGLCAREGRRVCRVGSDEPVCGAQPGAPEEERCDEVDHDCDGVTRDVPNAQIATGVPYLNLSVLNFGCGGRAGELAGRFCSAAIHQYCATQLGCWASGFGPTFADGSTATANVVCLHDGVTIVRTTIGQLAQQQANCNGVNKLGGIYCNAAIDNFCVAQNFRGGYGPVTFDAAGNVDIACLRGPLTVDRVLVPWGSLTALHGDCNPDSAQAQAGGPCMYAANQHCVGTTYYAGFGPVQDVNPNALVICLRR